MTNFIEDNFWYIRGVSQTEAKLELLGKDGRVKTTTLTNRGNDNSRLAFCLANNTKGINIDILDTILPEVNYYATLGAHAENGKDFSYFRSKNYVGKILVFVTQKSFNTHKINEIAYGENWKTTSEIIENSSQILFGIFDANPMIGPSHSDILSNESGIKFTPGIIGIKLKLFEHNTNKTNFKDALFEVLNKIK